MKRNFYAALFVLMAACYCSKSTAQANQNLSNLLAPTAVNADLLPKKTSSFDLGALKINWRYLFVSNGVAIRDTLSVYAPGINNFFAGMNTGNPALSGQFNAGMGFNSLSSVTSGYRNTSIGSNTLSANTTGFQNTAIGYNVLTNNLTGISNTAIGEYAMFQNTTGGGNTAVGSSVMTYNNASDNTAMGSEAMSSTGLTGGWNTGIGSFALDHNTSGSDNTALGEFALHSNSTGTFNTAVGASTNVSAGSFTMATALGAFATVNASHKMQLGASTTVLATTGGITIVSDGRFKDNVSEEDVPGLGFINQLHPVAYTMNYKRYDDFLRKNEIKGDKNFRSASENPEYQKALAEKSQNREVGFIAQEVDKLRSEKNYIFNGVYVPQNDQDNYALDYSRFVVPLVKAVQELSRKDDENAAKIEDLQQQINELKAALHPSVQPGTNITLTDALLEQNIPNPFHGSTTISYKLPEQYSSARIIIYDRKGSVLKEIPVSGKGKGTINVDAVALSSGAYSYSLLIDGRTAGTKQMVIIGR